MIYNIIVAAGSGSRFGASMPKQYCDLAGRPVLCHAIDAFRRALPESQTVVVVSRDCQEWWLELCREHGFESPRTVIGGANRWESVRNAVMSLGELGDDDVVTVHDGARPLVDTRTIVDAVAAARSAGVAGAIPVIAVTDSVRMLDSDGTDSEALDRSRLRAVQTPQAFPARLLREAYMLPYSDTFTDDASVVSAAGLGRIVLTAGSPENIKITHPIDLAVAQLILASRG